MEAMRSKWTDERLDDRFGEINGRVDRLEARMDLRFDRLEKRLDWLIGLFVAAAITVIAKGVFGA